MISGLYNRLSKPSVDCNFIEDFGVDQVTIQVHDNLGNCKSTSRENE